MSLVWPEAESLSCFFIFCSGDCRRWREIGVWDQRKLFSANLGLFNLLKTLFIPFPPVCSVLNGTFSYFLLVTTCSPWIIAPICVSDNVWGMGMAQWNDWLIIFICTYSGRTRGYYPVLPGTTQVCCHLSILYRGYYPYYPSGLIYPYYPLQSIGCLHPLRRCPCIVFPLRALDPAHEHQSPSHQLDIPRSDQPLQPWPCGLSFLLSPRRVWISLGQPLSHCHACCWRDTGTTSIPHHAVQYHSNNVLEYHSNILQHSW